MSTDIEMEMARTDLADAPAGVRKAMLSMIRKGELVDSGKRRKGRIVWIAANNAPRN